MKKLLIIFTCSLLVVMPCFAEQITLLAVKHSETSKNQLELEYILSAETGYKLFILPNPYRLVVDFESTTLSENIQLSIEHSSYIKDVRTARRGLNDLRLVIDFKEGVKPKLDNTQSAFTDNSHLHMHITIESGVNDSSGTDDLIIPTPSVLSESNVTEINSNPVINEKVQNTLLSDWEFSGKLSFEELGFFHQGLSPQQHNNYVSGAIEPEIYREWDGGKQSFTFIPFFRYSQHDSRRTHFDIRELNWLLSEDDWELRVGFRKVFWGVAEGEHLVDIINQTDLIENTDTEDKFGQPMVNLALIGEWGTLDLFVLPGFRERSFPGPEGRLRTLPQVSVGDAQFERHGFKKHMAYAARWSQVLGDWDIGLSHFYGTSREPVFKAQLSPTGQVSLIPYYDLINQTGLDIQLTYEDWIVKHEGIVRSGQGNTFYAMTTGIEYTLFDLFSSGLDLGLVVEYMFDTRSGKVSYSPSGGNIRFAPFQDDILTALRFGFNDVQSTEILAGVMFDRTNNAKFYNIEASRRIGDNFKVNFEMRLFSGIPVTDPSYLLRKDDRIRLEVSYYF